MANMFDVRVPSALEALMAGRQGYDTARQYGQDQSLRQAGQLYAGGDLTGAQAAAAGGGQSGLALLMNIANQQNNQRDFAFRESEAARSQGNTDRAFNLQAQQAQEAARGYDYREVDDGNGGKKLVRINKQTGQIEAPNIPGSGAPNNPFAYGKMNETESKDAGYANRLFSAEQVLRDPAIISAATSYGQNIIAGVPLVPGAVKNTIHSNEYQKFDQAARNFVNAVLRRESGAAISQSEFENAYKQYFPQPGDSAERIAQKQQNRQDTIASIAGGGGRNYKPPYSFGAKGELQPTGNSGQGVVQGGSVQSAPVRVSSPQERDKLAPGTQYVAPDGSIRTKQ